uniref:Uncharacterized protein n=1 Tax=Angiostrongylus cantonensis TaxID=6313 RepID=A0A0K0D6M9_ANGCA
MKSFLKFCFSNGYVIDFQTREGVPLDPLHVVTNIEMNLRDKEALHPESVNDSGNGIELATQSDVPVQHVRVPNVPGFGRRDQEYIPFYEKSRGDIDNHNMIIS